MVDRSNLSSMKILEDHYQRVGQEFQIQYLKGRVAKKRLWYPSGKRDDGVVDKALIEYCNQRSVLPDEIVIDLDGETTLENGELMKEVEHRLNLRRYSYDVWHSGNKGVHYHLYFPELAELEEYPRKYVKAKFLSLFKDLKADQAMKSERVNIQMENAPHRKTLQPKTHIKSVEGSRHSIPKNWLSEASRVGKTVQFSDKIRTKGHLHPKAKELLNCTVTDARKRIAFYLAAHLRNAYTDKEKVLELLLQWNDRQTKKQSIEKLKSTVNSVFNSKETPGNQYLNDIMVGVEVI